jgi:hypothetical protein
MMKKAISRWAILAIAVPVAAWALGVAATKAEESRGHDSKLAKGLRFGRGALKSA